jgi:serine/threonine-protein kinase
MELPKFDRYVATGILGEGAMGTVYRGLDPRLKREVAIKTVRPEILRQKPELRARFEREAKAVAALHHPAIVQIFDFSGEYLVMELLQGEELKSLLLSGREFTLPEVVFMVNQLADALDYAHAQGIIHRDLKPANLFIDPQGRPKITDFGVAKMQADATDGLTEAGKVLGTPAFMSPEQVQGQPLDGRSDQFSLGVVVYQLLTGRSPFAADSLTAVIHKIINVPPPPLQSLNPAAPASQEPVMQKVLAKWREERYPDCRAFAAAFAQAAGITTDPRLTTPPGSGALPPFIAPAGDNTATVSVATRAPAAPAAAPGNTVAINAGTEPEESAADRREPRSWKVSAAGLALVILGLGYLYLVRSDAPAPADAPASASPPIARPGAAPPVTAGGAVSAASSAAIPAALSSPVNITPAAASAPEILKSAPDADQSASPPKPVEISAPQSIPATGGASAAAPISPASAASSPAAIDSAPAAAAVSTPLKPPASSPGSAATRPSSKPKPAAKSKAHAKPKSATRPPAASARKKTVKPKKPLDKAKGWLEQHLPK